MDLALYCPVYGYYEKEKDNLGRRGDFFTSVSVGALFGELLAFQFAEWLSELEASSGEFALVEAGAHDGRLARDILTWLRQQRAELFSRLNYFIVEPSERRRQWQAETLAEFQPRVRWVSRCRELTIAGGVRGIVFANELLDALPVHRVGWDGRNKILFEWGVALCDDQFVWKRMPGRDISVRAAARLFPELPNELWEVLPDGFITELCPAAADWWQEAATMLRSGKVLTLDYGLAAEEFFSSARANGTLRGYRKHHVVDDPLADPGEQDLTAHVNFTALQRAGEAAGLRTEALWSQEKFFAAIVERLTKASAGSLEWTPARARQFQTLTHPEHMGRAFRVLIQSR